MSQAWVSGDIPHLPVCDLCLQHDRRHGSDTLSYHPHKVALLKTECTKAITITISQKRFESYREFICLNCYYIVKLFFQ